MKLTLKIILLVMTIGISQNIYSQDSVQISITQLKQTNLIFNEHRYLVEENKLLTSQLENYKEDNETLLKINALINQQKEKYEVLNEDYKLNIEALEKSINKKQKEILYYRIGISLGGIGVLIWALIK